MNELSVAEAAEQLGVSARRVRALLEHGRLEGRQVGGRWLLPSDQVESRRAAAPAAGRPLSQAAAWGVIAVLANANDGLKDLSPQARSRARARAAKLRLLQPAEVAVCWRSALRRRARASGFYAHPGVIKALLDDPRVVRSGISAAHDHGANLMVMSGAEAYVRARDVPGLMSMYALNPEPGVHADVRLHIVEDGEASWLFRRSVAPAAVVAADLVERDNPRDRAAGLKLAARV